MAVVSLGLLGMLTNPRPNENRTQERVYWTYRNWALIAPIGLEPTHLNFHKPHPLESLAYFLGSKAENADFFRESIEAVLQDYIHWRRNYFPADLPNLTKTNQRHLLEHQDRLAMELSELMARLRKNFPFYSPRYIAHQLSDTTMPSMLGYIAGMLYNPNNVTPEAAPVTVDLEYEACNSLLEMLGYSRPPTPLQPGELFDAYKSRLKRQFGWAHISPGGTTANMEALWVARNVKYFPLAAQEVAIRENLTVPIKTPNGTQAELTSLTRKELVSLRPNESIYLLHELIQAVRSKFPDVDPGSKTWELLNMSPSSPTNGFSSVYNEFPPVILASGASHYSLSKAADILGIGRNNIVLVPTDKRYRIDMAELRKTIYATMESGKVILSVVGILGTTEEGACDPCHRIWDLRGELEEERDVSFWFHIDAAWGGFVKSIVQFDAQDDIECLLAKICTILRCKFNYSSNLPAVILTMLETHRGQVASKLGEIKQLDVQNESQAKHLGKLLARISSLSSSIEGLVASTDHDNFQRSIAKVKQMVSEAVDVHESLVELGLAKQHSQSFDKQTTVTDRIDWIKKFATAEVQLNPHGPNKSTLRWDDGEVIQSFFATSRADSVTLDGHKMGYLPYPNGAIAFKNDRVRHFITQQAPYITSMNVTSAEHLPVKFRADRAPQAFAPFVLEGSRPGAAAAALHLSIAANPLTMRNHGHVVRNSLLAARELYERILRWDDWCDELGVDSDYKIVPISEGPPDTNIVCFVVQKKSNKTSLALINEITTRVYQKFSIETELGETEYSYSQRFFLSKTVMSESHYCFNSVSSLLQKGCGLSSKAKLTDQYRAYGIVVLRATVMSPYYLSGSGSGSLIRLFMEDLGKVCQKCVTR